FVVFVNGTTDLEVVGQAATGREAVELARATKPDVVVMDIRMPDLDGIVATKEITAELEDVKVLILTTFEIDEYVFEALRAGASGFLGKSAEPDELLDAIRAVHRGEALLSPAATRALIGRFLSRPDTATTIHGRLECLTEREREVLGLVGSGLSNEEIATQLVLSAHTVKTHVNRTMTKLGAHDRAQLVIAAYETALVQPASRSRA